MIAARRVWPKHLFRIATLVVPSWLAWYVAYSSAHAGDLIDAVAFTLGTMWVVLTGAFVFRSLPIVARRHAPGAPPMLAKLDVLTSSGATLAWLSAFAIMAAVWVGWASLAVVGLLGAGLFHVVVLLTFIALRGGDPLRGARLTRRFAPEVITEGDELREELRLDGVRIPLGFRLFVAGRVGPRFATSRHVLEATDSGAEVLLESKIGRAVRGEHDAEPLELWLQDTFGLCRSARVHAGAAHVTVLPRMREAEQTVPLLDLGDGPRAPRAGSRLPTEGHFRLRKYHQGDDVRRIHWMRSVASRELIVRLPDELPPDRPRVRLVLDTYFPEASTLAGDAASELLDSMVGVWIAVGKALVESGARVTLVSAVVHGEQVDAIARDLRLRALEPALRLGAQITWQGRAPVEAILTGEATLVVSRTALRQPNDSGNVRGIVVFPSAVSPEPPWRSASGARFLHPAGSADNRWSQRRREERQVGIARRDRARVVAMRGDVARPLPGSLYVTPAVDGPIRLEVAR